RFSVGFTAKSRDGHGATAHIECLSLRTVAVCSALGRTLRFYGRERVVVTTDASKTSWGAVCNGHAVSGSWTGPRLQWHINCLELLTVLLALRRLRPLIQGKHVLVHADNTVTVAYINRQGGLRSRCMSQLARHLLLWSLQHVKSLRAIHIPGHLNRAADALSCQDTFREEWRLHPHTVQLIRNRFGEAQINLFASHDSTHCLLWYSLVLTDALVHSWPRGPRKYGFPQVSLIAQTLYKVREERHQFLMVAPYLAQPDLVHGPHAASVSSSLANSPEEGPSFFRGRAQFGTRTQISGTSTWSSETYHQR
ncbi:hypothetical protein M9458_025893, partial [Cirrhinus mrigala]